MWLDRRFLYLGILIKFTSYVSGSPPSNNTLYEGAQVWRVNLDKESDLESLKQLEGSGDVSVWKLDTKMADFLVTKAKMPTVRQFLGSNQLNYTVTISDVRDKIAATSIHPPKLDPSALRAGGHRMDFVAYPTIEIIDEYFDFISKNHPSISKVESIGETIEKRPIKMVTISNKQPDNEYIVVTAGLHSREWAGITSALYIINEMVTNFNDLPDYMKNKDWYIMPLVNPDGYNFTMFHDRLWRKNRRIFGFLRTQNQNCIGVDLNRNFRSNWQWYPDVCLPVYPGKGPFSEPESAAVMGVVKRMSKIPSAYIDIHTFGQYVLYSAKADKRIRDFDNMHLLNITRGICREIKRITHQDYTGGSLYNSYEYPSFGTAGDWFYSIGTNLSLTIEARDRGAHGFLLPPEFIIDTGRDMYAAANYAARVASKQETLKP